MGKVSKKGRYICKVGFLDVYAADSMRKNQVEVIKRSWFNYVSNFTR